MGASKTQQYNQHELAFAKLSLALAHPARVRIMQIIDKEEFIRNIDLLEPLNLTKSTIHKHIKKLKDANLIELEFLRNSYRIKPLHSISSAFENKFNELEEN